MDETAAAETLGTTDGGSTTGSGTSSGTEVGTTTDAGSTGAGTSSTGSTGSTGDAVGGGTGFDPGVACPDVFDPVCGKDGMTYGNACYAGAAGVEIRREGPCLGDCEGSCVVAPQGPSLLAMVLVVLAVIRPRRACARW